MRCSNCAKVVDPTASRCASCGAALTRPDALTAQRQRISVDAEGGRSAPGATETRQRPKLTPAGGDPLEPPTDPESAGATASSMATAIQKSAQDPSDPLLGKVIANRYEVLALLGVGGMGRVYKVRHTELDTLLCLKKLKPDLANRSEVDQLMQRFRTEAKTTSRFQHPNIIRVVDSGTDTDGSLFYVMEYVEGKDLDDTLAAEFALSDERSLHILEQLLDALAEAHSHRVVHRDLKPKNIMLEKRRGDPDFVRVLDFGIAKVLDETKLTATGHIVGTAHYMSPEQAMGQLVDPRSDLYAVGVMFYELVTGVLPFDAETPTAVLFQHVNVAPLKPRSRRPDIPDRMEALILKALAKDPAKRPQTAEVFRDEIRELQAELKRTGKGGGKAPRPDDATPHPGTQVLTAAMLPSARSPWLVPMAMVGVVAALAAVAIVAFRPEAKGADPAPAPAATPEVKAAIPTRAPAVVAPARVAETPPPRVAPAAKAAEPARAESRGAEAPKTIVVAKIPEKSQVPPVPPPPPVVIEPTPEERAIAAMNAQMVRLAEAKAFIGCDEGDEKCPDDERPSLHIVLPAFRMDRYEVTGSDWLKCVEAGRCAQPAALPGCIAPAPSERRPINCVTWRQSGDFCAWRGARLPSEFEWERAARGAEGRAYPWGNEPPTCPRAAFDTNGSCGGEGPSVVGTHPAGATPEGIQDLAGNVKEWTADPYAKDTYRDGAPPRSGSQRIARGGAFDNGPGKLLAHYRLSHAPDKAFPSLGLRCVK